jgi:hypothetical protein
VKEDCLVDAAVLCGANETSRTGKGLSASCGANRKRRRQCGRRKRLRPESHREQRLNEHALRASDGADGLETAVADAVINGASRYVQQLRGLID